MKKIIATGFLTLALITFAGQGFAGPINWDTKSSDKIAKATAHQETLEAKAADLGLTFDFTAIESLIAQATEADAIAVTDSEWKISHSLAGQALDLLDVIEGQIELAEATAEAEGTL